MKYHLKKDNQAVKSKTKISIIFFIICLCFLAVFIKIAYIQIWQGPKLALLAHNKNKQLKSMPVQKGQIFSADGQILAASLPVYSLYADPTEIKNTLEVTTKIAPIIEDSPLKLNNLLQSRTRFVWLKRYIDEHKKAAILALNLKGIGVVRDFERIYPAQNYLAKIIGFSGEDGQGLEGLELQYQEHLKSTQTQTNLWNLLYQKSPSTVSGGNIKLTIVDAYQHIIEEELAEFVDNMQANNGLVMMMDSKTGGILAAASYPSYNPNVYNLYKKNNLVNPFVGKIYEPGSTFKLLTIALALDYKNIEATETFDCHKGKYSFFGHKISDSAALGISNLEEIVKKSSNICAAQIGLKMTPDKFYEGLQKFGLLQKTGIKILGEVSGQLLYHDKWRKIDHAILSFGQGIGVTPLQMIAAVNVFANKGYYVSPYIIESLLDSHNNPLQTKNIESKRIISAQTAELMKQYMVAVVEKQGTGKYAQIVGINIAGKTGTAQKFDTQKMQYYKDKYLVSFASFLPAEDPKYTFLTIIDEPKKSYRGSKTATILFREIAKKIMVIDSPIAKKQVVINNDLQQKNHFIQ